MGLHERVAIGLARFQAHLDLVGFICCSPRRESTSPAVRMTESATAIFRPLGHVRPAVQSCSKGRDSVKHARTYHRTKFKSRSYRMAKGHFQTSHQAAEESIDKNSISAGPIRFSVGTWPTSAVRLSKESSRLSPIMK